MIPRFGPPPDPNRTYTLRRGAYAVLPRGRTVLLTLQDDPGPEFQLPGGGIDPGESPIRALHREVFEETGWQIGPPRRIGAFRRFTFMPEYGMWAEKLCLIFVARPTLRIGIPPEEGHQAVWADGGIAATLVGNSGDAAMLDRVFATARRGPQTVARGYSMTTADRSSANSSAAASTPSAIPSRNG